MRQVDDDGHETIENLMQAKPSIPCYAEEVNEHNIKLPDFFAQYKTVVDHPRDSLSPIPHQGDKTSHGEEKLLGAELFADFISKEQSS